MQNFELKFFPDSAELSRAVTAAWLEKVAAANHAGKSHFVALSGGRITQIFFPTIVEQSRARAISLERVHFFWADERCVPPDDRESNFRAARELLFEPLKISEKQIHRVRGELAPAEAAKAAETEIRGIAPLENSGQPMLDLIFLGLGEDGHTASLFPNEPEEISNSKAVYRAVLNSPKPPPERVTLGFPALAAAREVWMLASGKGKTKALNESLSPNGKTPFARVLRSRSHTRIFSDVPPE
ncbi:MAG TPA: 6-phosphogluconolactonase [Verrucomicrobiae bacterium]|nr:6-phosphogluconolactonase [Verrucomicrobiae bacterium]